MNKILGVACLAALLAAPPVVSQVRQATPQDEVVPRRESTNAGDALVDIGSPMLIDISLGEGTGPNGKPRKALNATPPGVTRGYPDASGYRCEQARVGVILVQREDRHGTQFVTVTPSLSTERFRQDVNLRVSLLSEGKEVRKSSESGITIGGKTAGSTALGVLAWGIGTSTAKAPKFEWQIPAYEWDAIWKARQPPVLRVVLEIVL
ncbi:MAG TPA: hypothetical protein VGS07_08385 [Thermoanaerobaculia bacterium]|jgi:hypothetical protein|nr:hypothetical protein [Thermoanaerobaculia bacterium]